MANPQYQAIEIFANLWQEYKQRKYFKTPKDWGAVNTLLEYGLEPDEYISLIRDYMSNPRWTEYGNHAFHVFVYNINNVKPIEAKKQAVKTIDRTILCSDCRTPHHPDQLCPKCYPEIKGTKNDAINAIKELGERWKMK